jgi:hydroxyethylthiazole kinase-like sugar kinase family protein
MSIEGLGISLSLVLLVVLWVAAPLLTRGKDKAEAGTDLSLIAAYERALLAIRDLEEDVTTGKIDATAYGRERERWVERGIAALRELDAAGQFAADANRGANAAQADEPATDAVEQALAAYRRSARSAAH